MLAKTLTTLCALITFACSTFAASTFQNPLLPSGPDPWVIQRNGFYYYMNTTGVNLTVWKTKAITDLAHAEKKVVWHPPAQGPYSRDLWAPELHFLDGKWYIYFAADEGHNEGHRIWVLENASADPLDGTWTLRGKLADPTDRWAIDATVFENAGVKYVVWSGWEGTVDGSQNLYIAKLRNPYAIDGPRVMISKPSLPWETIGDIPKPTPRHVNVNEGPEAIIHNGRVYLTYSASGCWTDHYALGLLTASAGADLTNAATWTKSPEPVFTEAPGHHAFGPGHNGFFTSPDGTQSWIIYHANPKTHQGCSNQRSPRAQPFTWNADGSPSFGTPVDIDTPMPVPSGQQ